MTKSVGEPYYTLEQARAELARRDCELGGHRPVNVDGHWATCACVALVWTAAPASVNGRRDALRDLADITSLALRGGARRDPTQTQSVIIDRVRADLLALGATHAELDIAGIE